MNCTEEAFVQTSHAPSEMGHIRHIIHIRRHLVQHQNLENQLAGNYTGRSIQNRKKANNKGFALHATISPGLLEDI